LEPHKEQIIAGYRVVERLNSGATSEVLLAARESHGRVVEKVVLKLLSVRVGDERSELAPFQREVDAFRALSHPALVGLQRALVTEDGEIVLVLEHVPGLSLEQLLEQLETSKRLPDGVVLYVMERVFAALAAAHAARPIPILHGEMRASNLLLGWDGTVKLTEFGITKILTGDAGVKSLPRSRFSYVSPEEVRGEPPSPASDVYAAGVIFWELLSGHAPPNRQAHTQEEIARALAQPNLSPIDQLRPDLPLVIRQLVDRLLLVDHRSRTLTAQQVVDELTTRLPLERGKQKLSAILAPMRPADAKPPSTSPTSSALVEQEVTVPEGQAGVFRSLGGGAATARRRPRSATRPSLPSVPKVVSAPSVPTAPTGANAPSIPTAPTVASAAPREESATDEPRTATTRTAATGAAAVAAEAALPRGGMGAHTPPAHPSAKGPAWVGGLVAIVLAAVAAVLLAKGSQAPPATAHEPPRSGPSANLAFEARPDPSRSSSPTGPLGSSIASDSPPVASAPASESAPPPADMGDLRTGRSATERRIFVDGHVVGEGIGTFRVKCGARVVRIGSSGRDQHLEVPCGGELAVE
jgi:eukaryotic-like serine/threonine-protein kinase